MTENYVCGNSCSRAGFTICDPVDSLVGRAEAPFILQNSYFSVRFPPKKPSASSFLSNDDAR